MTGAKSLGCIVFAGDMRLQLEKSRCRKLPQNIVILLEIGVRKDFLWCTLYDGKKEFGRLYFGDFVKWNDKKWVSDIRKELKLEKLIRKNASN